MLCVRVVCACMTGGRIKVTMMCPHGELCFIGLAFRGKRLLFVKVL